MTGFDTEMARAKENPKGKKAKAKAKEATKDKWNDRQRLRMAELYEVICDENSSYQGAT